MHHILQRTATMTSDEELCSLIAVDETSIFLEHLKARWEGSNSRFDEVRSGLLAAIQQQQVDLLSHY